MTPAGLVSRILSFLSASRRRYRGTRGLGQKWEDLAEKHLKAAGYRILERNLRTRAGELDFVAKEGRVLCFIEVKARSGTRFGAPAEAVTGEKRRRVFRAAQAYLRRSRLEDVPCRFDVVAILQEGKAAQVTLLRDAFEAPPRWRRPRR